MFGLRRYLTAVKADCTCNLQVHGRRSLKTAIYPRRSLTYCTKKRDFHKSTLFASVASAGLVNVQSRYVSRSLVLQNQDKAPQSPDGGWLTIPNILTLTRLVASPYIGYLVLCHEFNWALALVFFAGLTDSIDGWIARNFKGQASNIGSYIDPLADKVMISILTLSLTYVNVIPLPLCGLIIARDVLLVLTSSHFHYKHLTPPKTLKKFFDFENSKVKMEPTQISKYNTFLQLGLVALSVAAPVFQFLDHQFLHAYWYLVGSTTVVSGLSYVVKDKTAYIIKKKKEKF